MILVKSCEFYRLRETDKILDDKIREVEEYVKEHKIY